MITDIPGEVIDGCVMAYSIEDAISKMDASGENFIIGGGSVYRQFLPHATRLYITWVHRNFEADTFFPAIDLNQWQLIEEQSVPLSEVTGFSYSYCIYQKK